MSQGTFWVTSVAQHYGSQLCIMPTAGGHDIRPNQPLNEHMRLGGLQSDYSVWSSASVSEETEDFGR